MFHDQVEPILKELSSEVLYSDVVKIDCMGESKVAEEIEDLIEKQTNPTVAPYAKLGEVHLRVTAKATSEEEAKKFVAPVTEELYRRFGHKIFTTKEDETLEDVVVNMLSKHPLYDRCSRILYSWHVYRKISSMSQGLPTS